MKIEDKLKLRELLFLLLAGLEKYPNDRERAEQGIIVLENYIDSITNRELSAIVSGSATLEHGGIVKGGNFNKNKN